MSVVMECESRIQHETLNDCRDEEDVEDHGVQTVLIDQNGSSSPSPSPSISSQDGTMGSEHQQHHHAVKQWSYEEQFRQVTVQLTLYMFMYYFASFIICRRSRREKISLTGYSILWLRKVPSVQYWLLQ